MTKNTLDPRQLRTVEIIEALGFGAIRRLPVRGGMPCYDPEPHIVQEIKLGAEPERRPDHELKLKREFEVLFNQLSRLGDGFVDIDVRHSAPFRLVLNRSHKELAP